MTRITLFLSSAFLSCLSSLAFSAILIVDNNIPSTSVYTTLQDAHDAASNGDIIQVIPSNSAYTGITVGKQLEFIGAGFSPLNFDGIFIKHTRIDGTVNFSGESEGSRIKGFGGQFEVLIIANNITVQKCFLRRIQLGSGGTAYNIMIASNLIVPTNYYPFEICYSNSSSFSFNLLNNIVYAPDYPSIVFNSGYETYYYGGWQSRYVSLNGNCFFVNNTFILYNGGGSTFLVCPASDYDATIMNNIGNIEFSDSPFHTYNVTGPDALTCITSDYHTAANSSAIDSGNPNIAYNDLDCSRNDCGAYGGPTPFVDGGIPGLPAIYEINGPGVATPNEAIPIQIKAKTNRE